MIRYALACEAGHEFESWFKDAAAFESLSASGLVACPSCGDARVAKRPMAPAVARGARPPADARPHDASPPPAPLEGEVLPRPAQPHVMPPLRSEPDRRIREMIAALRRHVEANAENVGPRFADEARAIHEGAAEERGIYGEASAEEVRALLDDGVEVHPLPILPDDRH